MGYYHQWKDFPEREISYLKGRPESSKLLVRIMSSERMMVTNIHARKGAFVPLHHHGAEQIILVLKGKIKAMMGKDSSKILGPGGIWVVPSNHPHSVKYRRYRGPRSGESAPPGQFCWIYDFPYVF